MSTAFLGDNATVISRTLAAAFVAFGLVLASCGGDEAKDTSSVYFDADSAKRDIEILSQEIGSRPAGSPANDTAADYIATEFGNAHFGVIRSQFEFETSPNREATAAVGSKTIPAVTAGGSGFGSVTGPAAMLATTGVQDLTGKVAVALRGGSTFQELSDRTRLARAKGLVIINSEPGPFTATLTDAAAFPVVTIAGSDADPLEVATAVGEAVTVTVTPPEKTTATNLIARPISAHGCIYAVVANYDSLPGTPGANDNASGIAVLLQLARGFGVMTSPPEVCLIAFDARSNGAAGSVNYLTSAREAGRPAVVIAISRIGSGGELQISGEATIRSEAVRIADLLGFKFKDGGTAAPVAGDSAIFAARGISTVDITRSGGRPFRDDLAGEIDIDLVREAVHLAGELALGVSAKAGP